MGSLKINCVEVRASWQFGGTSYKGYTIVPIHKHVEPESSS